MFMRRRKQLSNFNWARASRALLVALNTTALYSGPLHASPSSPDSGVVIVEFGQDTILEKAGVRVGDVLLSWRRESNPPVNTTPEKGRFGSFFDWSQFLEDQVPRGSITLKGQRGSIPLEIIVPQGRWRAVVRPALDDSTLVEYSRVQELAKKGAFEEIDSSLTEFLKGHQQDLAPDTLCWLETLAGHYSTKARNGARARTWYQSALSRTTSPVAQVYLLQSIGLAFQDEDDLLKAEDFYSQALAISEREWGENLMTVTSLKGIYLLAWRRRDLRKLEEYSTRVMAIIERQAPSSLLQADTMVILGVLAVRSGDFETALTYYDKALAIRRLRDPNSPDVAEILINLGNIALRNDQFNTAETSYIEAQRILEAKAPDSEFLPTLYSNRGRIRSALGDFEGAKELLLKGVILYRGNARADKINRISTLNSLSILAQKRGDLTEAADWSQQAVKEVRQAAPKSSELSDALSTLGSLRYRLGELDRAKDIYQEALNLIRQVSGDSLDEANILSSFGRIVHSSGDLQRAERLYKAALSIRKRRAPQTLAYAIILHNLGDLYRDRNQPELALTFFRRALKVQEAISPRIPDIAVSLKRIGSTLREMGRKREALETLSRALAVSRSTALETSTEADILYELSQALESLARREEGLIALRRSVSILNSQAVRIETEDDRINFRSQFSKYYQTLVRMLHQLGKDEEAFAVLEAYRAQSFLALLAERDLLFTDVPPGLEAERRKLAADYDTAQKDLPVPGVTGKESGSRAAVRLREIREQQMELAARIRSSSPNLASLKYPKPLELADTQRMLDPGTAMVSYSVGRDETIAFVVLPNRHLEVYTIPIRRDELDRQVKQFRSLLEASTAKPPRLSSLVVSGRQLFDLLLEPADKLLSLSRRVVIIPDGPLHNLPFSALIRDDADVPSSKDRRWQFMVDWRPLHLTISATVYSEVKESRRPSLADTGGGFVGFGDPLLPEESLSASEETSDSQLRRAAKEFHLGALPWTRQEISRVSDLFPGHALTYLRQDATEARAKSVDKHTRYVHFATHGLLNEEFPLNSSLVLTIPAEFDRTKENGLLQAWEIFERVRIDADLVVLSACESGLGKEMGGEGLIGLTRAFQYAGARSVMASLWKISDRTTAELMVRFYKHLKEGMPKDEALRAAQMELIHGPIQVKNEKGETETIDASAPYYWAAFQIYGDWQ